MARQTDTGLTGMTGFPTVLRLAARGGKLATLVSAFAFAFSAVSFYETVLKQAHLKVYVTDTLSYTRDPYGGYEVIALPIAIANSGARDGAVVTLDLTVTNKETGEKHTLTSAYTADAQYFGGREDVSARIKRPKQPFAPLVVNGRNAYVGTILLYTSEGRTLSDPKTLITPQARFDMVLDVHSPEPDDWLDKTFFVPAAPVALSGKVGDFLPGALYAGDMVRIQLTPPQTSQ